MNSLSTSPLILEHHAASGGQDAARFCAELATAYLRAADRLGWSHEIWTWQQVDPAAARVVVLRLSGRGVERLTGEAGAHRIIRQSGSLRHTSIVTVAVSRAEETPGEFQLAAKDLRIETLRASGHGGQNRNKVETAVRVTHLPSGLHARIAQERSQAQNKSRALELVRTRVMAKETTGRRAREDQARATQLGAGSFSERRRTYAVREGVVSDHLSGRRARLSSVLAGDFSELWD